MYRWARRVQLIGVVLVAASCGDTSPTEPEASGILGKGQAGRWATVSPVDVGLDPSVLSAFQQDLAAGRYGQVSSLLILRHGKLVFEDYWGEWGPDDVHPVYSVTKSVASLLVGIAVDEGILPPVDTPALDLFPAYSEVANLTSAKGRMTFEHLLQMRSGLTWDEWSTNYSDPDNATTALMASPDWLQHVLDLPMGAEPGSEFVYNSGVSMLLSGAIQLASGETMAEFGRSRLFEALGFPVWFWSAGRPDNLSNSGWGLRLRPRDMAALGQLVLQDGVWEGQQRVPDWWLAESRVPSTFFEDGRAYGYQWWLTGELEGTDSSRAMAAWGWGGQFVVVAPTLDMVIVSTAENYSGGGLTPDVLADLASRAAGGGPLPAPYSTLGGPLMQIAEVGRWSWPTFAAVSGSVLGDGAGEL